MNSELQGQEQEIIRPIAPEEVLEAKLEQLPNEVLLTFNNAIAENVRNGYAKVYQKDIVARLEELGMDRREIYRRRWLDVEELYRQAGWHVEYDKPGYNETYDAFFVFKSPQVPKR